MATWARSYVLSLALVALAAVGLALPVLACPTCAGALTNGDPANAQQIAQGWNSSVLVMMAAPFLLILVLVGMISRAMRRVPRRTEPLFSGREESASR